VFIRFLGFTAVLANLADYAILTHIVSIFCDLLREGRDKGVIDMLAKRLLSRLGVPPENTLVIWPF
jgi:hypothetical protein